jgi:hypothetical protein
MGTATTTPWRLVGEEMASCHCAWGCPCQFNALPTHGRCEGLAAVSPTVRIAEVGDIEVEPIKHLVTGEAHRARIVLPQRFEFHEAEMGNAVVLRVHAGDRVRFEHHHTYTQLCAIDWSQA